ncbi:hypothetical protein [Jeotgalibacillus proteolyticus]|uniref:Uncharacterized protein n=1 Tax=Jeotgalibacillus proteolyticus TaxID=2082395 RepID=A0A2S5G9V3_9BACL|nr:hypothetical protein [Jeotgalibacillus proteolyticus]PPA69768.1 hypothetical protein C4B60_14625 [Jeotgalibacillus proteolyticus]
MLVWGFAIITAVSVVLGLRLKKKRWFALPFAVLAGYLLIEIIKVPLPFWDTITFIFDLRG